MIPNAPYLYIICIILTTRLFFQFRDDPITLRHTVYKIIIESLSLVVLWGNCWLAAVFGALIIMNVLSFMIERKLKELKLARLLFLLSYFVLFAFLITPNTNVHFNPSLLDSLSDFKSGFILLTFVDHLDWNYFWLVFTGLLLVLNEANIFIRYLMESLHLVPYRKVRRKTEEIDTQEYNRGRVIGILERILIYYFVLNNHLSAVGFILAAKGVTRFKELEDREFAEYFLIGTLLSSIISGAIALMVKSML